ncbi:MAG: hypothetical protein HC836_41775 [Richelia sp. RM2_1_2]|nr:hypothetical protein [Richelia sp. RM2_1_2]
MAIPKIITYCYCWRQKSSRTIDVLAATIQTPVPKEFETRIWEGEIIEHNLYRYDSIKSDKLWDIDIRVGQISQKQYERIAKHCRNND